MVDALRPIGEIIANPEAVCSVARFRHLLRVDQCHARLAVPNGGFWRPNTTAPRPVEISGGLLPHSAVTKEQLPGYGAVVGGAQPFIHLRGYRGARPELDLSNQGEALDSNLQEHGRRAGENAARTSYGLPPRVSCTSMARRRSG